MQHSLGCGAQQALPQVIRPAICDQIFVLMLVFAHVQEVLNTLNCSMRALSIRATVWMLSHCLCYPLTNGSKVENHLGRKKCLLPTCFADNFVHVQFGLGSKAQQQPITARHHVESSHRRCHDWQLQHRCDHGCDRRCSTVVRLSHHDL